MAISRLTNIRQLLPGARQLLLELGPIPEQLQQPLVLLGLTGAGQKLTDVAQSGDGHIRGLEERDGGRKFAQRRGGPGKRWPRSTQ